MSAIPKLVPSLHFQNILCATDFSSSSDVALGFARGIAARFESVLHLVHVLPPQLLKRGYAAELDTQLQSSQREMAELLVRHHLEDVRHEVTVMRGLLSRVLDKLVQDRQVDLIVLGTHGRHGLAKLALGSVAEEIFRRSECPVLTVGPNVLPDALAEGYIDSVLYATDFSPSSSRVLWYAMAFARESPGAELLLLHALSKGRDAVPSEFRMPAEFCRHRLRQLVPADAGLCSKPETLVAFEPPADAILETARRRQVRLIVMGAKKSSLGITSAHLPCPTAYRVVSEAPCPVLTVRA